MGWYRDSKPRGVLANYDAVLEQHILVVEE